MSVKVAYRQGRTEFDARAFLDYAVRRVIVFDEPVSNVLRLPIDPGRWILGVRAFVATAFNGGSTVKIGDAQNDAGYIKATDLDLTAVGAAVDSRMLGTTVANTAATFTPGVFIPNTPGAHAADTFAAGPPASFTSGVFTAGVPASHAADVFVANTAGGFTLNAYAKGGRYYASSNFLIATFAAGMTEGELVVEVIYDGYEVAPRDMVVNQ